MNFFDFIVDFFSSLWLMLSNFISGIQTALTVMITASTFPLQLASFCSPLIFTSIIIVVSLGIIKLMLGWGNN